MDLDPSSPAQASLFEEGSGVADFTAAWTENSDRDAATREAEDRAAHALERRRMIRGLLLVGVIVLLASLARAGIGRAFYSGWWRQW
ncbi:hypothetical protein SAMN05421819_2907 [Bryocella elongata]|uniref:Uncharacterized protein n=1 Tax=Bryocella elongata TaxID=863522 RepID=A0A1H6A532_9BACT|nr:hypothetical protein [Bryocella elongata]SEG43314.1 hypothetical protein SAMN05421819_2907 [Bryocella elongata]